MDATPTTIGSCPHCEVQIAEHSVLIEYQSAGETRRFAECPSCAEVVAPR